MNQQINLMPVRAAIKAGVTAPVVVGSCLLLAVLCGGLVAMKSAQLAGLDEQLQAASAREQAALRQTGAIGATLAGSDDATLAALVQSAEATLAESARVLEFLEQAATGPRAGFSARLAALARQSRDGLWLTRITINADDSQIALKGTAQRPDLVPDYLAALATEPAFDGQQFRHFLLERPKPEQSADIEFSIRSERPAQLARHGD